MAPYFARMCVLEHYRNFYIPKSNTKWYEWKRNVLTYPCIATTLQA